MCSGCTLRALPASKSAASSLCRKLLIIGISVTGQRSTLCNLYGYGIIRQLGELASKSSGPVACEKRLKEYIRDVGEKELDEYA